MAFVWCRRGDALCGGGFEEEAGVVDSAQGYPLAMAGGYLVSEVFMQPERREGDRAAAGIPG